MASVAATESTTRCLTPVDLPSQLGDVWKNAIGEYEKTTGKAIETLSPANTVDAVLEEIRQKDSKFKTFRHDGSRIDKFRSLVSQSLEPIAFLSGIVAHATKHATLKVFPPSEAIFGAVKFLISTANAVSEDYDKISGFFEELKSYLTRLKIWEEDVPQIPGLLEVITDVFTSVLVLCGICTKYLRARRIVKAFRALSSGEDSDLKDAYERFHRMVAREEGLVRNAILSNTEKTNITMTSLHESLNHSISVSKQRDHMVQSIVDGMEDMRNTITAQETLSERENILEWFSELDFRQIQRDVFGQHHKNTGYWLLDHSSFQDWFKGDKNTTLWCPGIPGSGKTVMVSTAVSYVEENTDSSNTAIAFIYFSYKDEKTHSAANMWSSITRQLAEQCIPLPAEVKSFRDRFLEKRSHPTDEERIALLKTLSGYFDNTYIFIDALDECPEDTRDEFISSMMELETHFRLFITSRESVDLRNSFTNLARLDIVANKYDVHEYIESLINTNKRLRGFILKDPSLEEEIFLKVREQAGGMFLLVRLQMALISCQNTPKKVRATLETRVEGVGSIYEIAMKRIEDLNQADRELAVRALSYVFCARRPLSLGELLHALSTEPDDTEADEAAQTDPHILFSVTTGLLRHDEQSGRVALVHYTLHEYFRDFPGKLLNDFESQMAQTCLTYLSFDAFDIGPCVDGYELDQRLETYRFLGYAAQHWGHHVAKTREQKTLAMAQDFLDNEAKLSSSLQVLCVPQHKMGLWYDGYPREHSALHAAAFWGLDAILPRLTTDSSVLETDIDGKDSHGDTALHLGSQRGHSSVVLQLLQAGAKTSLKNDFGETALICAAKTGHQRVVETLLANEANFLDVDDEGWTAVHWAIISGHDEVVRTLLNRWKDIQVDQLLYNKALIVAAEAGNVRTMETLLDYGADLNWRDEMCCSAIHWAIPEGHLEATRLLIKRGADVNLRDYRDDAPIHWAIPFIEIARLLLDTGADVDAKNDEDFTALHWAAQEGRADVLQLMVEYGADVNAADCRGFTALHAVALNGHREMAELLLNKGADPNARDKDGWAPLYAAAVGRQSDLVQLLNGKVENGSSSIDEVEVLLDDPDTNAMIEEMIYIKSAGSSVVGGLRAAVNSGYLKKVEMMLKSGVDIEERDAVGGSTALTLAAWLGLDDMVKLLLDYGANTNARERNQRTPLYLAAYWDNLSVVVILVENGADVDAKVYGQTPALIAAKREHSSIVKYLVETAGADVNTRDYLGRTMLHWACDHEDVSLMQFLLDNGVDAEAKDREDFTAHDRALEYEKHWAADYLAYLLEGRVKPAKESCDRLLASTT